MSGTSHFPSTTGAVHSASLSTTAASPTSRTATATSSTSPWSSTQTTTPQPRNGDGGVSVQTVFYFIAFLGFLIAICYTIHMVRRDRRRRRLEQEGRGGDAESGMYGARSRYSSTFRPEDDDACPPPQYRAYTLDQPLDPETALAIVTPGETHCQSDLQRHQHNPSTASSQLGLVSHALESTPDSSADHQASILTPNSRSITAPNANNVISSATADSSVSTDEQERALYDQERSAMTGRGTAMVSDQGNHGSVPVISAPSPAFSFAAARQLFISRNGRGSNGPRRAGTSSSSSPMAAAQSTTSLVMSAVSSPSNSRPSSPAMASTQNLLSNVNSIHNTSNRSSVIDIQGGNAGTGAVMTERSGSNSGILQPTLNRLRSQGPPPYVAVSTEGLPPQLPPEYLTAVAEPL
ncbi:unnamed protein product [Mortierella alpina]